MKPHPPSYSFLQAPLALVWRKEGIVELSKCSELSSFDEGILRLDLIAIGLY